MASDRRPVVVCLCGSTRFHEAYAQANLDETLAGKIVLTVGCMARSDAELGIAQDSDTKAKLDQLHLRKIDMCDEILVLNVDGYVGESTWGELCYAVGLLKRVRFLEPEAGLETMARLATAAKAHAAPVSCAAVYDPEGGEVDRRACVLDAGHAGQHTDDHKGAWSRSRAEAKALV